MSQSGTFILIAALFIIMFGMGLTLTKSDFLRILRNPKAILTGLINQLIFLPLAAFAIVFYFDAESTLAVGLIIIAACPGGATSNLITHLANGDTALSISLTAISSLITIFTIPILLAVALNTFMGVDQMVEINVWRIFAQLLVIIVIPVSLGMLVRNKKPLFADNMEKPVKIASAIILALVIAGLVIEEQEHIVEYFKQAGIMALSLNLIMMAIGFISALLMRLSRPQILTISIETGIQNGTMAIGIATIALQNTAMAIPAAIYSLIMFASGFVIILIGTQQSSVAKRRMPES